MPVTNDQFDQLKIDRLKHFLEDMAAKGQPKPFEIFVDGLKVIPKTEDPKDFESYEYYVNEDTEKIRILIYNSNLSPRNDQYCFYVQQNKQEKSMNGLGDIDHIIQEKLAARDREYEMNQLKTELQEAKKQLEESEEYAEQLEEQLQDMKANKFKLGNINLGELASLAMEGIIRRNPQLLSKLPGGEALAGIIEQDNQEKEKKLLPQPTIEGDASFQKKSEGDTALNEVQTRYLSFLSQLEQVFDQQQLESIMTIIQKLAEEPAQLPAVKQLLNL